MSAAPSTAVVPTTLSVLITLMRVTWLRLFRGRALWVSAAIGGLPVLLAGALSGGGADHTFEPIEAVITLVMVLLPPMFVSSSLGEEIEDRTTTYLWSRPIPRWTVVIGKLLALAPIAALLVVAGAFLAMQIDGETRSPMFLVAHGIGALAIGTMAAGLATLVPKHGMALSIVYLVVFDLVLGALPASISNISITKQVRALHLDNAIAQPAVTIVVLSSLWLMVALWRIRRLES